MCLSFRMHPFYGLPRPILWAAALLGALSSLAPFALLGPLMGLLTDTLGPPGILLLVPAYVLLIPLAAPWIQFATAPLLRLLGVYRYYSPMLLVENPRPTAFHIHGGTNLDYLLHLRWRDRGAPAARKTLCHYLRGLVAIGDEVAGGALPPDLRVVATSYVFTETSARRLGFTVEPVAGGERLGLWLNGINLVLKHSFAQGRPALPDLSRVRRASISGADLAAARPALEALLARLEGTDAGARSSREGRRARPALP